MFNNTVNFVQRKTENGLTYSTSTIGDLVNKDTDGDGVPDWEESLWGTDPTKKETVPGVPDSTTINKLKANSENKTETTAGNSGNAQGTENLTKTDQFSRELFSTVAALNQNGAMDQATADKISSSLAEHIQNSPPRKVYALSDLKIIKDDSVQAIKNYANILNNLYKNNPIKGNVMDVLQKFIVDQNNVDSSVLTQLDPIIKQIQSLIDGMVKINVPQSLAPAHLDFLNALQRLSENISDIKLYDTDSIIALAGISQYDTDTTLVKSTLKNLASIISQKLNN